jgi:prepilin-type N-terminal cleavage/methylation domain-containing protein
MKKKDTAFTLIELIVAMALLSLILLGIFSIGSVLNTNHQDYGQKYLIKSETQTTLNHILNNASLAVGSATSDAFGNQDLGILIGAGNPPGVGDANSFCIHQAANNNIINSAADIWLCYTINANQIYWCTSTFTAAASAPSFRGAAAPCTGASTNYTFLGTAYSISNPSAPAFTAANGFSITIQNCLNNSLGTCSATGTSTDPANNPEIQLSGSVTPAQEGM